VFHRCRLTGIGCNLVKRAVSPTFDYVLMKLKRSLALFLGSLLVAGSVVAQGLRPEAVRGAALGGVAGAIIGNNSGALRHNTWRGAAIGAGTGLVLGSIAGDRSDHRYRMHRGYSASPQVSYIHRSPRYYGHGGFRLHAGHRHGWRNRGYYYGPSYVYLDRNVYGYDSGYAGYGDWSYGRPSYAGTGMWLGALAGAVIGNNSGDLRNNSWRGAAYGAAAGYVIGSIAENKARRQEAAEAEAVVTPGSEQEQPVTPAQTKSTSSESVTSSNSRPSSSMSSANRLFGR
jgi:uncharacterized protein YcfJ